MFRSPWLAACLGLVVAVEASAFSPGPPRPFPPELTSGKCSNDLSQSCDDIIGCDRSEDLQAICLVDPSSAQMVSGAAIRGTITLIADEDVTGWSGGADPVDDSSESAFLTSAGARNDRARLTLLLEFTVGGKSFAIAETFALDRSCFVDDPTFDLDPNVRSVGDPSLCLGGSAVSEWNEPISETNLIKPVGPGGRANRFSDVSLQWTRVNPDLRREILDALLSPADRIAYPNAQPLFEVIDGAFFGDPLPVSQAAQLDQFDHQGSDPLASIRRLKVTIRVAKGTNP